MRKRSLAQIQVQSNIAELLWLDAEIAAAEARCHGQLAPKAYQFLKDQEQAEYLTPQERLDFWAKAEAGIQDGGADALHAEATADQSATIFEKARQCIEGKQEWASGASVTIWSGNAVKVEVSEYGRDGGGLLALVLRNGKVGEEVAVMCGLLFPSAPFWRFTLSERKYREWVKRARKLAAVPAGQPVIVLDVNKRVVATDSHLSPRYRKQAQRARNA